MNPNGASTSYPDLDGRCSAESTETVRCELVLSQEAPLFTIATKSHLGNGPGYDIGSVIGRREQHTNTVKLSLDLGAWF